MKPLADHRRKPLSVWITLLYTPLGLQMLFWMMGFHYVDFSLPQQLIDMPLALLRYYVSLTILIYPLMFAYGLFYSLHLNRSGGSYQKVILASLLPFASAAPYLVGERIFQYFQ